MPDIALWNKCNNKCIMCTNSTTFSKRKTSLYSYEFQVAKLEKYLKGNVQVYWKNAENTTYISITGGEPTTHPDFFKLIYYIRRRLPETPIHLLTNGRQFKNETFAKKLVKILKMPSSIGIPIHSHIPKIHDKITGIKGSFIETLEGVKNLKKYFKGNIEIRIVIHRINYLSLPGILKFVQNLLKDINRYTIAIIHYEIEGQSKKNHKKISLKLTKATKIINNINKRYLKNVQFFHYPLCLINKELRKKAIITLPLSDRIYTRKCKYCILKEKCVGLMKEYYKIYGDKEIKTQYHL